jgi:parallel beta-helix repeat protein
MTSIHGKHELVQSGLAMKTGLLLLLSLLSISAFGQTYYVTPQGKASNDGLTWETAWTPVKASSSARAGDTIVVRKGEYTNDRNNFFAPKRGGTSQAPITIRGENPDDPPIIARTRGGGFNIRAPYIIIQDIGCRGVPNASCVSIRDTHNVIVKRLNATENLNGVVIINANDNTVMDSVLTYNQQGIYVMSGSDRNKILRNQVLFNGLGPTGDRDGIAVGGHGAGSDNIIHDNTVANNGVVGIGVFDAPRTVVSNNHVHNNGHSGIMINYFSINSLVTGNRVEDNGTACKIATNIAGITVRTGSSGTVVSNNLVLNNCVAAGNPWHDKDPRGGIDIRSWRKGDPHMRSLDNVKILNNRVSGTVNGPDFYVDPTANINGLIVY